MTPRLQSSLLLLLLLLSKANIVNAIYDFDDYVDPTFNCPATISCQQVCVATQEDCPAAMQCEPNQTLCIDGLCANNDAVTGESTCDDDNLESPCAFECAPVACPKVVNDKESCLALYGVFYDNEAACGEAEEEATTKLLSFTSAAFSFFYAWISGVTVLVIGWCAYNQRIAPIPGSTVAMQVETITGSNSSWQTGYKIHPVGAIIYTMTVLTLIGIFGMLSFLTIEYYVQQEAITSLPVIFEDEEQILKAFIMTWMIGFFWFFAMKYPYSISSIFLRRCVLSEATHVAVCVAKPVGDKDQIYETSYISTARIFFSRFGQAVFWCMSMIFSEVEEHGGRRDGTGLYKICKVQSDDGHRYFVFMFRRYIMTDDNDTCFVAGTCPLGVTVGDLIDAADKTGLTQEEAKARRRIVGNNKIEIVQPTPLRTFYKVFSQPFYTYQAFMVFSWMPLWYYYMAITWAIIILVGGFTVTFFQFRNEWSLYRLSQIRGKVKVWRDGELQVLSQDDLVPGDVIQMEAGLAYADMVVISTSSTLVDESALTGEATPKAKVPLDPTERQHTFQRNIKNKQNCILAGTTILESDDGCALVLHTASQTGRGELLREILSYKRHSFKFDIEVPIVVTILFFYAIFGFAMVIFFIQDTPVFGWFYGIYVVGTILPPLLPTVFTVSVGVSDDRLARKRIACTHAESILVAGKVTQAFFDKTGTLTKQGLEFISARSKENWVEKESTTAVIPAELATGMAVCHNLSKSRKTNELVGNPVDRTMFEASGGEFGDRDDNSKVVITDSNGGKFTVVKQFEFDHHRMSQSVIVKNGAGNFKAFVKGSAESIQRLCVRDSIPSDFGSVVKASAKSGIYLISMASKDIPSDIDFVELSRDEVETDLSFVGVINFKNTMREETPEVIRHLKQGSVRSVMVTGDSVLTGICIAKEAGIIYEDHCVLTGTLGEDRTICWTNEDDEEVDFPSLESLKGTSTELAMTGEAWMALRKDDPKEASRLLEHVSVVGRCTPYDKVDVVAASIELGCVTLMCGDGGNDCGALKMAHVGIALSDSEASIVAPFTSLDKTIVSVIEVLREGRCALASALASYKFMIMYGQLETINQLINAYFKITFTEWCWVFMDGIWTVSLGFALPLARSAKTLADTRPTASLLGAHTVSSVLGVLLLNFAFLVGALAYLFSQEWFQCRKWDSSDVSNVLVIGDNYESQVIFLVSGFQYITSAMAFNFGYEFRTSWYQNYVFVFLAMFYAICQLFITLNSSSFSCIWRVNCVNDNVIRQVTDEELPIQNEFATTVMPDHFQRGLLGLMIGNAIAISAYEFFVVNGIRQRYAAAKKLEKYNKEIEMAEKKLEASSMSGSEAEEA